MYIPSLNMITEQALGEPAEFPENHEQYQYMILFPEDYEEHGIDPKGNVALMLDEENAREVKALAEEIIEGLSE